MGSHRRTRVELFGLLGSGTRHQPQPNPFQRSSSPSPMERKQAMNKQPRDGVLVVTVRAVSLCAGPRAISS